MLPDDPRHGTSYGYRCGCRCDGCRRAVADAALLRRNRLYLGHTDTLVVSSLGTRRRIQALVALGWSLSELSRHLGHDRSSVGQLSKRTVPIRQTTAANIARLYDEMSMKLPPQDTKGQRFSATRARNVARAQGWPPPLAWDDIDSPDEQPKGFRGGEPTRAELLEDYIYTGRNVWDLAARCGIKVEGLEKWCEREGLRAEYNRLLANGRSAA